MAKVIHDAFDFLCYPERAMNAYYGIGAYSVPEASALLGVPTATLRRWLFGYSYDHHGARAEQAPLFPPQYGVAQEDPILGFRDLIEARMVRALRSLEIGLPTIRLCIERASEIVGDDHPFSTSLFKTDGRRIFLEVTNGLSEPRLIDLKARQHVFRSIVSPTFVDVDFEDKAAVRWWLLPNKKTIVLDPARSFGSPIVHDGGVPTARLAQAFKAEGSIERVANIFELRPGQVRDALQFEERRILKQAA